MTRGGDSGRACLWLLCVAVVIQIAVVVPYMATLHNTFKTSSLDIGVFSQIFHNLIHGRGFTATLVPPHVSQHWLGFHFSPILYVIAPLYWLWPDEMLLRVLNVVLLAGAAIPLFYVVRRIVSNDLLATAFAVAYLINPFVINAAIWDFHEISFAPLLFACGYLALLHKRRGWFVVVCLLLLCVKEHYGLAIFGLGLLWGLHHKEWRFGGSVAAAGLFAAMLIIGVVMPWLRSGTEHFMMVGKQRFSWLSHPFSDLIFIGALALDNIMYLVILLLGWVFMPLRAVMWLLPGLADLVSNGLSSFGMMRSPYSYHSAPLIIVFSIAAAQGAKRAMAKNMSLKPRDVIIGVMIMTMAIHYYLSALPFYKDKNFWEFGDVQLRMPEKDAAAMADIRRLVGTDDAVDIQGNIGAHFGDRANLYYFTGAHQPSHWIVLKLEYPYHHTFPPFGDPMGVDCVEFIEQVKSHLADHRWGIAYSNAPWLVLKRDAPRPAKTLTEIRAALDALQKNCENMGYDFTTKGKAE